jgi:hypothetical protein
MAQEGAAGLLIFRGQREQNGLISYSARGMLLMSSRQSRWSFGGGSSLLITKKQRNRGNAAGL